MERTASVYRASDHVGFEICSRKLEERTRMLIVTSQSQNSSLGDLFEVLEVSLAMLLRKTSDVLNTDTAYIRHLGLGELSLSSFETSTREHRRPRITASE